MSTKTVVKKQEGEDILGLVALGSLITNIFQIASKKSLEAEHEALKAYVIQLRRFYENIRVRERQVSNENLELKRANEGLIALNNRLLKELAEAENTIIKLKNRKSGISPLRRKGGLNTIGESK
ncbi:MAG: hypothetical protein HY578_02230 [Nitrospinae bacterium]|nr:hypothetical protein [Nitrospinota bacterium]